MNIVLSLLMGLAYVAPPGPVNVETTRRGLTYGFRAALCIQVGALVGDLFYALLALAGAGALLSNVATRAALASLGAVLLVYLGWSSLCDGLRGLRAKQAAPILSASSSPSTIGRCLLAGAAISLANPLAVAFWLSVGGAAMGHGHGSPAIFLACFLTGMLVWAVALPVLIARYRLALARASSYIALACGVAFIMMGGGLACAAMSTLAALYHTLPR